MDDRLRPLWDFDDLDATEERFRAQLEAESTADGRAEVLTQLARIHGLRGDFERGDALVDEAEALATGGVARARAELERGRLRRSSGDDDGARTLFEAAFDHARVEQQYFVAADAAHMAALVAPDRDGFVAWTDCGVELAETHTGATYWLGPLLNNLGWEYYEAGDFALALDAFERTLVARERDPADATGIALAREAVGTALEALGAAER